MFDAQWLPRGITIYSPWFPRGGDNLRATLELIKNVGSLTLTVKVWTKAAEAAGDGTEITATTISTSTEERKTAEWEGGLQELVRYQFVVSAGANDGEGVLFRMLDPVWFDTTVTGL